MDPESIANVVQGFIDKKLLLTLDEIKAVIYRFMSLRYEIDGKHIRDYSMSRINFTPHPKHAPRFTFETIKKKRFIQDNSAEVSIINLITGDKKISIVECFIEYSKSL
jgi:hypothetical protein